MNYDYVFYETDESFDYGQGTCYQRGLHGFSIDIDKNDNVDIDSLEVFGDYTEMKIKCTTLSELKKYLEEHLHEVVEDDEKNKYSKEDCFKELIDFIEITILREQLKELDFKNKIELLLSNLIDVNKKHGNNLSEIQLRDMFIKEIKQYV